MLICNEDSLNLTVSGLAKVAIITTNFDAENQTLINHKCVCGALTATFAKPVLYAAFLSILGVGLYVCQYSVVNFVNNMVTPNLPIKCWLYVVIIPSRPF